MFGLWSWVCRNPHIALAVYYIGLGVITLVMLAENVSYQHRRAKERGLWWDAPRVGYS